MNFTTALGGECYVPTCNREVVVDVGIFLQSFNEALWNGEGALPKGQMVDLLSPLAH